MINDVDEEVCNIRKFCNVIFTRMRKKIVVLSSLESNLSICTPLKVEHNSQKAPSTALAPTFDVPR